jgi:sugar phosphate isomerase/epimerase
MSQFKIGIFLDGLKVPVYQAMEKAAAMGVDGFQVFCIQGPLHPDNFSSPHRKEFSKRCRDLGLVNSAFCGDIGGFMIEDDSELDRRIAETIKMIELCADMQVGILTSHFGGVHGKPQTMIEGCKRALRQIGQRCTTLGVTFASETGSEKADQMAAFLDDLAQPGIGVNYDPANLVMKGWDHLEGVKALAKYIVHTHAKDGLFGEPKEVPLGTGSVDFQQWISNLNAIGFYGFLTVEREVGDNPAKDIQTALDYLKQLRS